MAAVMASVMHSPLLGRLIRVLFEALQGFSIKRVQKTDLWFVYRSSTECPERIIPYLNARGGVGVRNTDSGLFQDEPVFLLLTENLVYQCIDRLIIYYSKYNTHANSKHVWFLLSNLINKYICLTKTCFFFFNVLCYNS